RHGQLLSVPAGAPTTMAGTRPRIPAGSPGRPPCPDARPLDRFDVVPDRRHNPHDDSRAGSRDPERGPARWPFGRFGADDVGRASRAAPDRAVLLEPRPPRPLRLGCGPPRSPWHVRSAAPDLGADPERTRARRTARGRRPARFLRRTGVHPLYRPAARMEGTGGPPPCDGPRSATG